jgi:hypothetical protein
MKKLLVLLSIAVLIFSAVQERNDGASEVRSVARQFAQRLQETREFRSEGDELFVERFVECHLRAELEGKENAVFMQIPASIPPGIVTEARREELQHFRIALNLIRRTWSASETTRTTVSFGKSCSRTYQTKTLKTPIAALVSRPAR